MITRNVWTIFIYLCTTLTHSGSAGVHSHAITLSVVKMKPKTNFNYKYSSFIKTVFNHSPATIFYKCIFYFYFLHLLQRSYHSLSLNESLSSWDFYLKVYILPFQPCRGPEQPQAPHMSEGLKVSLQRLHMLVDVLCCGTRLVVVLFPKP